MRSAAHYRKQAARFRELAGGVDAVSAASLKRLAEDYDAEANWLDADREPPIPLTQ